MVNSYSDELVVTMVERMQRLMFQVVAHAFATKGEVTSCYACKAVAAAACVTTHISTEAPLPMLNYALF
jgi:hypothetical protein